MCIISLNHSGTNIPFWILNGTLDTDRSRHCSLDLCMHWLLDNPDVKCTRSLSMPVSISTQWAMLAIMPRLPNYGQNNNRNIRRTIEWHSIQCPQYEVINTGIIYYFTVKFVIGIRPAYYPPTIYSFVFVHFLLKWKVYSSRLFAFHHSSTARHFFTSPNWFCFVYWNAPCRASLSLRNASFVLISTGWLIILPISCIGLRIVFVTTTAYICTLIRSSSFSIRFVRVGVSRLIRIWSRHGLVAIRASILISILLSIGIIWYPLLDGYWA